MSRSKNLSVTFRTICYGAAAICSGIAVLYSSGAMDDIKRTVGMVMNQGKEKVEEIQQKKETKTSGINYSLDDIDERIKNASHNYYVDDCFKRHN